MAYTRTERWLVTLCWLMVIGGPAFCGSRSILRARELKRVRVTMSSMRRIATAWEARATALGRYGASGQGISYIVRTEKRRTDLRSVVTAAQLRDILQPEYLKDFPMRDGWGHEWRLAVDRPSPDAAADRYAIASAGRDGKFEVVVDGNVPCEAWECDIVFANGQFITTFGAPPPRDE